MGRLLLALVTISLIVAGCSDGGDTPDSSPIEVQKDIIATAGLSLPAAIPTN